MTSRIKKLTDRAATLERFPDFPPRDDMQNSLHLHDDAHQPALRQHLGNYETTVVLSEVPVRWTPSQQEGHRIPDLLVAFNVDRSRLIGQNGYSIRDQGKPPDFVLEVASETTGAADVGNKRRDYAAFGIPEYWRYDPTGGERHGAPMAGDRLVDGEYQPISIVMVDEERYWGHSEALNLDLCWESGQLRWYDPVSQRYIANYDDQANARIAAEGQANIERNARIAAEGQASIERDARIAAERQANIERDARIAAEARVRELEKELKAPGESP